MTGAARRFQLAVFDVAGTTVLDGDAVAECLLAVVDERVAVSMTDVLEVMGMPKPVAIRQLLSRPGADQGDLETAVHDAHEKFRTAMIDRYRDGPIVPAEGTEHVFAALRRAGIRVALDTGFSRDILQTILDRLGWSSTVIDFSVASDEVAHGRPRPDLIYRAMAMADVSDAARVAKIGDTPSDIEEGLAARCGCVVGVTYGTHTREQLSRPGVQTIDRLADLLPLLGLDTG